MEGVPPDAWKWEVDRTSDPRREPGPINLQRYAFVPAYAGIATLFGLPLCLNPDDLRAGHVDVAVVGAPVDMSTGHRGGLPTGHVRSGPMSGFCPTLRRCWSIPAPASNRSRS